MPAYGVIRARNRSTGEPLPSPSGPFTKPCVFTISASTIGGSTNRVTHFADYLNFTGTEMVFDISDTLVRNDLEFFGDSGPLRNGQTITIPIHNLTWVYV